MLEEDTQMDLKEYRSFIDEEMFTILGQMDSASKIFDHVYLVSSYKLIWFLVYRYMYHWNIQHLIQKWINMIIDTNIDGGPCWCVCSLQGSEWNASNLEELKENG